MVITYEEKMLLKSLRGLTELFYNKNFSDYDYNVKSFGKAVTDNLASIDTTAFFSDDVEDDYIEFTTSKRALKQYSNMMRHDAKQFACARKTCETSGMSANKRIYLDLCGTDAK
ncbi:unnamed protein product [Cylicocyclus nassatus]|uniref:Uncharacterized protein n=1 Tax=Cylicocyclus nassatus TaxID=53992 RepID=A0AA36H0I1_CYLNA|nr:unnamed protein product [Cylicocyclus nassatus]